LSRHPSASIIGMAFSFVMRGLDPRIHPNKKTLFKMMDCRGADKST
jgi:hypothetical protein